MISCLTPLPPSRTGIADYSVDLLERMQKRVDVKIYVDDLRSQLALPAWPVYSYKKYHGKGDALYQLGNNCLHRFVYDAALRYPGVAVLHDVLLQHMVLNESWDAWEREFAFTYGERGREIAANLRNGCPASHEGFFRYPLVKRVVDASKRVIVSSEGARSRVLHEAPNADVRVIPLPFVRRVPPVMRRAAREELGIRADAFLVACFGFMRESRLLPDVLAAVEELRTHVPHAEFAMIGEFNTPEQESAVRTRLQSLGARCPGYVTDAEFEMWAAATDVVVNLRYPSAGEMSGVAVRMMGIGTPVILTESPENAAFPDDACLKVPRDERQAALLVEYLLALADHPELGEAIARNARDHIQREHDPDRIADSYLEALRDE